MTKVNSKGFTLPTSNTTTNGSFSNLITQTSANANTIVQAPLLFVRGGRITPGGALDNAGSNGYCWSPMVDYASGAYNLSFGPYTINPSNDARRQFGQSVRCVALGG